MADSSKGCPYMAKCPLYPLFRLESNREIFKIIYCQGDFNAILTSVREKNARKAGKWSLPTFFQMEPILNPARETFANFSERGLWFPLAFGGGDFASEPGLRPDRRYR